MGAIPPKAAQYVRMSTDRQDLSPAVQKKAIADYASLHGYELVRSYEDEARSGLRIENRTHMKRLIADVMAPDCPFEVVLVFDVSRWGRFLDTDASAYYEYHCRLHGVRVVYVAEPFDAEPSPLSAVIKSLKRAMAAEYSRELGVKCRAGQERAIALGYEMGSLPSIGLRRIAVSKDGRRQRQLQAGEQSVRQMERVRWVHGPDWEVALVRRIFSIYASTDVSLRGLVRQLNAQGTVASDGSAFTEAMVRTVLGCEAFIGNFVWGQTERTTNFKRRRTAQERVTRAMGTIEPIVARAVWERARAKLASRKPVVRTRERALAELRAAIAREPALTALELQSFGCGTRRVYERYFGSMTQAFRLAGRRDEEALLADHARRKRSRRIAGRMFGDVLKLLKDGGVSCEKPSKRRMFLLAGRLKVRLQLVWPRRHREGLKWSVGKIGDLPCQYVLLARMREDEAARDFLLVPREAYRQFPGWLDSRSVPPPAAVFSSAHELLEGLRALS